MITVNHGSLQSYLYDCWKSGHPALVTGSPGIGKSDSVYQFAEGIGYQVEEGRWPMLNSVDVTGLPYIGDNQPMWSRPSFFHDEPGWLYFLDEINAAPMLTQVAAYQLALQKRIGQNLLPSDAIIVAAGNLMSDRAAAGRISKALANRFLHFQLEVSVDDWVKWALKNNVRFEIIAYNRFKKTSLMAFDPTRDDENAFPTPRTWAFLSDLMDVHPGKNIDIALAASAIGEAHAVEFLSTLEVIQKAPGPDLILLDPSHAPVPDKEEISVLFTVATALSMKVNVNNADKVITYARRLPGQFSQLVVSDCIMRVPAVQNTRPFVEWVSEHPETLN